MSDREEVEALAKVIDAHHEDDTYLDTCLCEVSIPDDAEVEGHYALHVAQAILDSPAMRDLLAEAWDAAANEVPTSTGYSAGVPVWRSEVQDWLLARNPHRTQP